MLNFGKINWKFQTKRIVEEQNMKAFVKDQWLLPPHPLGKNYDSLTLSLSPENPNHSFQKSKLKYPNLETLIYDI